MKLRVLKAECPTRFLAAEKANEWLRGEPCFPDNDTRSVFSHEIQLHLREPTWSDPGTQYMEVEISRAMDVISVGFQTPEGYKDSCTLFVQVMVRPVKTEKPASEWESTNEFANESA